MFGNGLLEAFMHFDHVPVDPRGAAGVRRRAREPRTGCGAHVHSPPVAGLCRGLLLRSRPSGGERLVILSTCPAEVLAVESAACGWCWCLLCTETPFSPGRVALCRAVPPGSLSSVTRATLYTRVSAFLMQTPEPTK